MSCSQSASRPASEGSRCADQWSREGSGQASLLGTPAGRPRLLSSNLQTWLQPASRSARGLAFPPREETKTPRSELSLHPLTHHSLLTPLQAPNPHPRGRASTCPQQGGSLPPPLPPCCTAGLSKSQGLPLLPPACRTTQAGDSLPSRHGPADVLLHPGPSLPPPAAAPDQLR